MGRVGLPAWEAVVGSHRQGSGRAAIAGVKAPRPQPPGGGSGLGNRSAVPFTRLGGAAAAEVGPFPGRTVPPFSRPAPRPLNTAGAASCGRSPPSSGAGFLWGEGHQEGRPKPSLALGFGTSLNVM